MIQVTGITTASSGNILSGTDLASAPGAGVVLLWVASTANDTRITFAAPPRVASRNITPFTRTLGVPLVSDDSPVACAVVGGEQIILQVTIVTAGTCGFVVKFIPQAEL